MRKIEYLVQGQDAEGMWHDLTTIGILAMAKQLVRISKKLTPPIYKAYRMFKVESVIEQIDAD
jgi:hypothetical protein